MMVSTALAATGTADAETRYSLSTEAGITASSNPFVLVGGDREAIMAEASVRPRVTITGATGSSVEFAGVLAGRRYSRLYGDYVTGGAEVTGSYRRSERLSVAASASYDRDVSVDALAETGAIAEPESIRNLFATDASLTWRPDAQTEIRPTLGYAATYFEDSVVLSDTKVLSGGVGYSRRLSERTSIGLRSAASLNRAESLPDTDVVALFATAEQQLSTVWRVNAELGVERVSLDATGLDGTGPGRADTLFSGQAQLCGRGERATGCFEGSVATEASGLGGLQRRYALGANVSRTLSARHSLAASVEYQRSSARGVVAVPDLEALRVQASLDWRLNPVTTLSGQVVYLRREVGAGLAPDAGFVGVQLRWQPRLR